MFEAYGDLYVVGENSNHSTSSCTALFRHFYVHISTDLMLSPLFVSALVVEAFLSKKQYRAVETVRVVVTRLRWWRCCTSSLHTMIWCLNFCLQIGVGLTTSTSCNPFALLLLYSHFICNHVLWNLNGDKKTCVDLLTVKKAQ